MNPKLPDPLQARHDPLMTSADAAGKQAYADHDRRQERQRVTKDWRDLAELLQQSSG